MDVNKIRQISIFEIMEMNETPDIPFKEQKKGVKGWVIEIQALFTIENGFKRNMIGVTTVRVILDQDSKTDCDGFKWQYAHVIEDGCKADGWSGSVKKLYKKRPTWKECCDYVRTKHKEPWDIVFTLKDGHACTHICDFETKQPIEKGDYL